MYSTTLTQLFFGLFSVYCISEVTIYSYKLTIKTTSHTELYLFSDNTQPCRNDDAISTMAWLVAVSCINQIKISGNNGCDPSACMFNVPCPSVPRCAPCQDGNQSGTDNIVLKSESIQVNIYRNATRETCFAN